MTSIRYFILGFVVAIVIIYLIKQRVRKGGVADRADDRVINPEQVAKRKENLGQIIGFLANRGQIANDDVQKLLGVSNATAERYLNELEQQEKIEQVGEIGPGVFYRLKQ